MAVIAAFAVVFARYRSSVVANMLSCWLWFASEYASNNLQPAVPPELGREREILQCWLLAAAGGILGCSRFAMHPDATLNPEPGTGSPRIKGASHMLQYSSSSSRRRRRRSIVPVVLGSISPSSSRRGRRRRTRTRDSSLSSSLLSSVKDVRVIVIVATVVMVIVVVVSAIVGVGGVRVGVPK